MPQLILHGNVFKNGYESTEMFAIISFGSLENPCDHEGNPINGPSALFDEHLRKKVIPLLQNALADTEFQLTDQISNPYNSTLSSLTLKKKDKSEASDADMEKLTALLTNAINSLNDAKNSRKTAATMLFKHASNAMAATATATTNDGHRQRRRH